MSGFKNCRFCWILNATLVRARVCDVFDRFIIILIVEKGKNMGEVTRRVTEPHTRCYVLYTFPFTRRVLSQNGQN